MSFIENLNWRYATKKFNGVKVPEHDIQKIKDAIRLAPTSFGAQPFHIVVVEDKTTLEKLCDCAKHNEPKFHTCSHAFVFCARTDLQNRFEGIEKIQGRPKGFLSKVGMAFEYFMPAVYFIMFKRVYTKKIWSALQAYVVLGFAMAACAELKVDSSAMEGFDSGKFAKILKLPSHVKPVVVLAVGYRDAEDVVYPKARFSEEDIFTTV